MDITNTKENYSVYLVRHGQSEFNLRQLIWNNSEVEQQDNENFELKFCDELLDCALSPLGVIQVIIE